MKNKPITAQLDAVVVALDRHPIGVLAATGRAYEFTYFSEHHTKIDALPLSFSYPLRKEEFSYAFAGELPPYFNNLLPEGWLKEVAEAAHLPMETALEKLATLCRDNPGAVEIYGPVSKNAMTFARAQDLVTQSVPDAKPSLFASGSTELAGSHAALYPQWSHCVRCQEPLPSAGYNKNFHNGCALAFFGTNEAPMLRINSSALVEIAKSQLARHESLTGVQPKFSATFKQKRGGLADLAFIVKPEPLVDRAQDGVFYKYSAVAELAAMHLVAKLGLVAAEVALLYLEDGQPALVTKRFDRQGSRKIHTEDLAQALSARDKYKGSYEKIASVLKKAVNSTERGQDLQRLLQITIVNFIIGNCDSHLKNFSLIYDSSAGCRLAPFYDVLPIKMFAKKDPNQLGLSIDGKANLLTIDSFDRFAIKLGLNITLIDRYVEEIEATIEDFFATFRLFGVPDDFIAELRAYCMKRLDSLRR